MKSFLLAILLSLALCGSAEASFTDFFNYSNYMWGPGGSGSACVIDDNAVLYDDNCLWEITF